MKTFHIQSASLVGHGYCTMSTRTARSMYLISIFKIRIRALCMSMCPSSLGFGSIFKGNFYFQIFLIAIGPKWFSNKKCLNVHVFIITNSIISFLTFALLKYFIHSYIFVYPPMSVIIIVHIIGEIMYIVTSSL